MASGILHLIFVAYFPPCVGCIIYSLLMCLQPSFGSGEIHLLELIIASFILPFFTWPYFLPLAFCTLFLCRFAASRRYYSLSLWVLFWSVLGVVCGWFFTYIIEQGRRSSMSNEGVSYLNLMITGAVVGALFGPLLRYSWKLSYGEQEQVNWK